MMNMTASSRPNNLRFWWFPMLFGVLFMLFGFWILRAPEDNIITLTKVIGAIILVSGTTQIIFTIIHRQGIPGWGIQIFTGVIDLALGLLLVFNPIILLKIITFFVGIWLIVNSVQFIIKAIEAKDSGRSIWSWEMTMGILLLILAVIFLWHPGILGITIAVWAGVAFIILGIFRIVLAIRLRKYRAQVLHEE